MSTVTRARIVRSISVAGLSCLALAGVGLTATAAQAAEPANTAGITQANENQQYTVNNHTNKTVTVSITTPARRTYSAELDPGESATFTGDFAGTNLLSVTHNGDRLMYGAVIYSGFGWQSPSFPGARVDYSQTATGTQAMLDIFAG